MFLKVFTVVHHHRRGVGNYIFSSLLTLLLLLNMLSIATPVQAAPPFPLTETFKGSSAPGWVLGGTAILTSGNADPTDDGWLRLTRPSTYQAGYAYYNTAIPTNRGLVITFDYGAWGGSGADGLSFFLFDGVTTTFNIGASGGSLGYAQKTGFNGLSGGYLGLGLDEFGNYSNPNEGRVGGPGYTPQALAIRGPGTGTTNYAYLAGTTRLTASPFSLPRLDCPKNYSGFTNIGVTSGSCGHNGLTRPDEATYYRQVQITLTPVGSTYQVTVAMKFGPSDVFRTLLGPFTMPTSAPRTLKMGFAGSTGGSTNYHEIRNLIVTEQVPDLTATKAVQNDTTGAGSVSPGEQLLYTVRLQNNTSSAISGVHFTDAIPTNTTYVPGSATVPTGSTLNTASPTLDVTGITVPANGQATVTFKVQVDNPLPVGVTQISNQGSFIYNSITSQTDGDAVIDGNQATTIGVTTGANFDNSTKTVTYEDLDGSGAVSALDRLTYHVVLSNTGDTDSPTTTFSDILPTNTTYVTGSATVVSGGGTISYNTTSRTIGWTKDSVSAGSDVTLEFKVTVNSGVQIRDVISNQGTITYDTTNVLTDADLSTPGKQPTQLLVGGIAKLSATKTVTVVGGGDPQPGSQLLYTILLSNTGNYAVSAATFTDTIPTNTTYVSSDTDTGVVSFSSPTLNVTGIDLASGSTATIHLTVQIASSLPSGSTQILNQGTVFWDSNQSGMNNTSLLTDSDSVTAGQQPTLVTVTGSPQGIAIKSVTDENGGNLVPGDILLYTVVMQNQGVYDALGLQFLDSIPANTTYVAASVSAPLGSTVVSETPMLDITGINVPANGQVSLSFRVQLDNPLGAGVTQISNQGIVWYDSDGNGSNDASQYTDGDTTESGNQATILPVTAGANFNETTKSVVLQNDADTNGVVSPGDTLRYTVMIMNTGDQHALGVSFLDPLPITTTYVADSVSATSGIATYSAGSIGWTGDVNAGGSVAITYDATVNSGIITGTVISNQGTVTYDSETILTDGNTSEPGKQPTQVTTGGSPQGIAIKSVTDENGGNLVPGDILLYTVVMQNQSVYDALGLEFLDSIPANTTYVPASVSAPLGSTVVSESPVLNITGINVPAYGQVSLSFRVQLDNPLGAGVTQISNQGIVWYDSDGNGSNDASQYTDGDTTESGNQATILPVTAGANFNETTKSVVLQNDADTNGVVSPGDTLRYTVMIMNTGDQHALGVSFLDPLPITTTYVAGSVSATSGIATYNAGSIGWTGDVNAGQSVTITFDATVNSGIITGTVISNQGTVTYASETILTDGNTSEPGKQPTQVTTGGSPQGIAIKSVTDENGGNLVPGDILLYTVVMQNQGVYDALGLEFLDSIPANTTYVAASVSAPVGSTVFSESPELHIKGINVPAHTQVSLSFRVQLDNPLGAGVTQISNQGIVWYDSDGNGSNDASQQTDGDTNQPGNQATILPVTAVADLSIIKTGRPDSVLIGSNITYNLAVSNVGAIPAENLVVTDTLSDGVTFVSATGTGWTCEQNSGVVTCERPTLAVGAEADITVEVTADETAVSPITNHVTIVSNTIENNTSNNSSDAMTTLLRGNFGHVPSAYLGMNLLADGGAWAVTGDTYLGQTVTTNATDGINEVNYVEKATDDGVTWTGDDWVARTGTADVEVTCPSGTCYLYAWADWNQNNQFTEDGIPESNELIYSGSVVNGINHITFNLPIANIPPGIYYTRFRVYANQPDNPQPDGGALTSDGIPIVGEIEDPTKMVYGPLVVIISGFEATAELDGSLVIRWETTMETDLLYFNLLRSNDPDGDYSRINPEFILSQAPGSIMGNTYQFKDSTAAPGVPSYYTLEMVLVSGTSIFFGPISGVPVSNGYFYFMPLVFTH